MKAVILVFAGASAAAFMTPVLAQTISQPSGCVAGVPCQAASLALGGATLGPNTLAATGTASISGIATVGSLSSGGNVRATTDAGLVTIGAANDVILSRRAAGVIQHGDADTASPVAQTITAQSVAGGTSNAAAPNLTITAPKGTGTGAGGSLVFQVSPAGSTGSTQNASVPALTIDSTKLATFAGATVLNGNVTFGTDAIFDFGASGNNRARNAFITGQYNGSTMVLSGQATAGQFAASAGNSFFWSGRSQLLSGSDGAIQMTNNAGTGFTALNFGPATASFPRLAVSGNGFTVQTGDGSTVSGLTVGAFVANLIRANATNVASLSLCNSGNDGTRQFVTDATATTFASVVTGGGSNHVPVYCDGSGTPTWKIG
jgi:hypothetical protein